MSNHITFLSSTNNSQGGGLKHLWEKITAKFALKSHTHTKSEITDFPTSMPASDVYSWAKKSTKPSYDISEISNVTSTLRDTLYPVGSIYLTIGTTYPGSSSPASWLGGTWQRLPEGYALWTASSNAGSTISAGLPNITGSVTLRCLSDGNYLLDSTNGCFGKKDSGINWKSLSLSSSYKDPDVLTFNASNSNSLYGSSSTVQPPAYKIYAWKRTD